MPGRAAQRSERTVEIVRGRGGDFQEAALIAQPCQFRVNLLGMTFHNRLESWHVQGDRLTMRGNP